MDKRADLTHRTLPAMAESRKTSSGQIQSHNIPSVGPTDQNKLLLFFVVAVVLIVFEKTTWMYHLLAQNG